MEVSYAIVTKSLKEAILDALYQGSDNNRCCSVHQEETICFKGDTNAGVLFLLAVLLCLNIEGGCS